MDLSAADPDSITGARRSARADDVLAAAAGLLETNGYSTTTMAQIGEAVGVLPGSLYHHFDSKENIAIELLRRYDTALGRVGEAAITLDGRYGQATEPLAALLTGVVSASYTHAAAVRLRSRDAPSVATARLRSALGNRVGSLDRAWSLAVRNAAPGRSPEDARLFVFVARRMALSAPMHHSRSWDPAQLGRHLADVLLYGLASQEIDDTELDRSEAMRAVREITAPWGDVPPTLDPRDEILRSARRELARRGFEATTMRDISNAAGVPLGTLYRRFDGKDAILRAIIGAFAENLDRGVRAALTTGTNDVESLDALAYVLARGIRCFPEESEILSSGWSDRTDQGSPLHGYFLQTEKRFALLSDRIAGGCARGSLRPVADAVDVAAIVRHLCWQPLARETEDEQRVHTFLRGILLRGYTR